MRVAYNLNLLLDDFSCAPDNKLFVNEILEKLFDITKIAIKYKDNSMYASSIDWYRIVFNTGTQKKDSFDLSYLGIFDKYFCSSIKYMIDENQVLLFEQLVFLLHHIQILPYREGKVWEYLSMVISVIGTEKFSEFPTSALFPLFKDKAIIK